MNWEDWIKTQGEKLTIRNYEDMTLSHVSFDAGYKLAIERAAKWFEAYLWDNNIVDWLRDSEVLENGRDKFLKDMGV